MINMNKIKELKDDKYQISLDNMQLASIIISFIALGGILFTTGYFIGKAGNNRKNFNDEKNAKNIAIINTQENASVKKKTIETKKILTKNSKKSNIYTQTNNEKIVKEQKSSENKNNVIKKEEKITNIKKSQKKEEKIVKVEVSKLDTKKIGKGTGENPFKTNLKSNDKGKYILQILATPKHEEASILKNKLIDSGYKAFIEKVNSKGVEYNRVRIGFFESFEEASIFKSKFENESGIKKTFITIKK